MRFASHLSPRVVIIIVMVLTARGVWLTRRKEDRPIQTRTGATNDETPPSSAGRDAVCGGCGGYSRTSVSSTTLTNEECAAESTSNRLQFATAAAVVANKNADGSGGVTGHVRWRWVQSSAGEQNVMDETRMRNQPHSLDASARLAETKLHRQTRWLTPSSRLITVLFV